MKNILFICTSIIEHFVFYAKNKSIARYIEPDFCVKKAHNLSFFKVFLLSSFFYEA